MQTFALKGSAPVEVRMKKMVSLCLVLFMILVASCSKKNDNPLDPTNPSNPGPSGSIGLLSFDKTSYLGTNQFARITLVDADITAQFQPIIVKSVSDPIGISVNLIRSSGSIFTNSIRFSLLSSSGSTLKVSNNGTVTATYADALPSGNRTAISRWFSNPIWAVYADTVPSPLPYRSTPGFNTWANTINIATGNQAGSGALGTANYWSNSYKTNGWFGWAISVASNIDFSPFQNGKLVTHLKSGSANLTNIMVRFAGVSLSAKSYSYANDGNWHELRIPLSHFVAQGANLSAVTEIFGHVSSSSVASGDHYFWDETYFTNQ